MFDLHTHVPFDDETGNGFVRFSLRRCLCIDHKIVCPFGSHYETFLAIEDIMIPILLGEGGRAEKVGSSPGLGKCLCTAELSCKSGFQIFCLLLRGAKMMDRLATDAHQGVKAGHS